MLLKSTLNIIINGKNIGQWTIEKNEKAPFEKKICFDSEIVKNDGKLKIEFKRNTKSGNPFHSVLGFQEISIGNSLL